VHQHNDNASNDLGQDAADVSHHLPTDTCQIDAELEVILAAWPGLPAVVRAGIIAMVRAAAQEAFA